MAKTIKFNLICDDYSVRTIEDLQEHFSIEDVLAYYKNKLLQRWLLVRGYTKELESVNRITVSNDFEIAVELTCILGVETDKNIIRENVYILNYERNKRLNYEEFERQRYNTNKIIQTYNQGYNEIVQTIIDNKDDMAVIKAAVRQLHNEYMSVYQCDYARLFNVLYQCAPIALFAMLSYEEFRKKMLPANIAESDNAFKSDEDNIDAVVDCADATTAACISCSRYYHELAQDCSGDAQRLAELQNKYSEEREELWSYEEEIVDDAYSKLCNLLTVSQLKEILGVNLCKYEADPDGCWDDPEPGDKKCLILTMSDGKIRSHGNREEMYDVSDIKNAFVILQGIDYQCNNGVQTVLYMEV